MTKLRVTLVKSGSGYSKDQKRTIEALGIKRMNHTVVHEDNQAIRGMIVKIRHLVKVEEEKA